jgi:SOS-response transcriptional repressor LexA
MDIHEHRRQRLSALIDSDDLARGNVAAFARNHNQDAARLRQILNANYREGQSFGERVARRLELDLGLAPMYFDLGFAAREHNPPQPDPLITAASRHEIGELRQASSSNVDAATQTSPQRLKAALPDGVTVEALASVVGVGLDIASQWLSGIGPEVTLTQATAVQAAYGVNMVWLTKGKGDPGVAIRYNDEFRPVTVTGWKAIPVVGMAQLGDNGHWSDLEYPVGHGDGFVDFPSRDPHAYALQCEGDSMSPRIEAGEYVIVEPSVEVKPGKNVLLKSKDGRVMVKKFLYKAAGRVYLISINKAHAPISFSDDEIEKMHFIRAIVDAEAWRPGE